jgi:hypothetical protein
VHNSTHNFHFPDKLNMTMGDGTVPTYSAIIPAFKWAFEFEKNKTIGAKPVKLVNFCSSFN